MSEAAPTIIELRGVQLQFGHHVVLRDISFKVNEGEGVVLLGPSGTGKTLILKLIAGLIQPTGGEIIVMGQKLSDLSEEELTPVRANIGMLFQGAALFDSLTVYENVAYPLRAAGEKDEGQIEETVRRQLELVGLPKIQEKFPPQLSGGQKKRVGLARALASSPKIVLFDEPTTGLDPTATRLIDQLIIKLRNDLGITTVAVTHDIQSAERISNRWILVDSGLVLADEPSKDVSKQHPGVTRFISGEWSD